MDTPILLFFQLYIMDKMRLKIKVDSSCVNFKLGVCKMKEIKQLNEVIEKITKFMDDDHKNAERYQVKDLIYQFIYVRRELMDVVSGLEEIEEKVQFSEEKTAIEADGYPDNLVMVIFTNSERDKHFEASDIDSRIYNLTQDQIDGLEWAIGSLKEKRASDIILGHYRDGKTYAELAKELGISSSRVAQIRISAIRKLRHPSKSQAILRGYKAWVACKEQSETILVGEIKAKPITERSIDALALSVRPYNALRRAGIDTIGDLVKYSLEELMYIRNIGTLGIKEIVENVDRLGLEFTYKPHEQVVAEREARKARRDAL